MTIALTAAPGMTSPQLFTPQSLPILSPDDWPYPVAAVFNPGAAIHDGQIILLCRVEDRSGVSHLIVARSTDGRAGWRIDPHPLISPLPRPVSHQTRRADIWLSRSPDPRSWGAPEIVLMAPSGTWWDSERVGMGPPPLETPFGWLTFDHGVKRQAGHAIWRIGLALLDRENPARVLRRSGSWVLSPQAPFERCGNTPNRIVPTGLVHDPSSGRLNLYYGTADTSIGLATARLVDVMDHLMSCPADERAQDGRQGTGGRLDPRR